jgi:hypothetical protein
MGDIMKNKLIIIDELYSKFAEFLSSSLNGQSLVMDTLKYMTTTKEWPRNYPELTEEVLPLIMGKEAAQFFIVCMEQGIPSELSSVDSELQFLKICMSMFRQEFLKATSFSKSPMSFACLTLCGEEETKMSLINIGRADGQSLDLIVTPESVSGLIKGLLNALNTVEKIHGRKVDRSVFPVAGKQDL